MTNIKFLFPIFAAFILYGCSQSKEVPANLQSNVAFPAIQEPPVIAKPVPVKYTYQGFKFRDPFISLTGEGPGFNALEEVKIPNIASLTLKGIFNDGSLKMALISGGGITYMLKGSVLFDNRQRLIKGFSGTIYDDRITLTSDDKTTRELKLRERQ